MPHRPTHRRSKFVPLIATTPLLLAGAPWVNAQESEQQMPESNKLQQTDDRASTQRSSAQQLSAQDIGYAVEDELDHDALVSLDDVHVNFAHGVVTLTGQVDSLLAKERAARISETVKGVDDVDNRLVVTPRRPMSPEDLESAISHALVADPATEGFNVDVQADPAGQVTLAGQANSRAERELIGRVAKSITGVTAVRNDVRVNYTSMRRDSELVKELESILRWDAYIDDGSIDMKVEDGVVTLSGTVGSAAQKSRAEALAWTAGSKGVNVDSLRVADWKSGSDAKSVGKSADTVRASNQQIAEAVRAALRRSPRVASSNVDVQVEDGTVTLRGTVNNLKAKRTAVQEAKAIDGVDGVRDRMRVRMGEGAPSDQVIRDHVLSALANDPIVEGYTISVDVDRGTVELDGHVDSWFERGVADDAAARVKGVRAVENDLVVMEMNDRLAHDPYVDAWTIYDHDWYNPAPPTLWRQDSVIARDVREELWWSPFVDENEIDVLVQGGVATLTGSVASFAERRAASENALEGGAAGVINELQVRN